MGKNKGNRTSDVCKVVPASSIKKVIGNDMLDAMSYLLSDFDRHSFCTTEKMDASTAKMIVEMINESHVMLNGDYASLKKIAMALSNYPRSEFSFMDYDGIQEWHVKVKLKMTQEEAMQIAEVREWLYNSESKYRYRALEHGGYTYIEYPRQYGGKINEFSNLKEAILECYKYNLKDLWKGELMKGKFMESVLIKEMPKEMEDKFGHDNVIGTCCKCQISVVEKHLNTTSYSTNLGKIVASSVYCKRCWDQMLDRMVHLLDQLDDGSISKLCNFARNIDYEGKFTLKFQSTD